MEIFELWDEFEEWHAVNFDFAEEKPPVVIPTPTFQQFRAWYRDVYPLKTPYK